MRWVCATTQPGRPAGLRLLVDRVPERYAVIDAGTNSIKLHIAELDAGRARSVADRRRSRCRHAARRGPRGDRGDRRRTARADSASDQRDGGRGLAASTLGPSRSSPRQDSGWLATGTRSSRRFVLAPGCPSTSSPGRTRAGWPTSRSQPASGLGDGAIVAFDTGGGSSQFTFGHGSDVDERFSVNVGAVRFTEQFGLANGRVARRRWPTPWRHRCRARRSRRATTAGRGRGHGRRRDEPGRREARPGTYDPDVVQGTVLDRAEIDRQIEQYRTRDADGRREIVGLQPARAEVILAGAASSARSSTSSAATRSRSATAAAPRRADRAVRLGQHVGRNRAGCGHD
jgi:exopolyphosphatase/guanosine-5'-triphosphate,3'-diphosphate pyrophosphatase